MNTEKILKDIEARKKQFLAQYSDRNKFLAHRFNNEITSVTRKSDSKTFKLGDSIYNMSKYSKAAEHKIIKFEIKQRQFSRLLKDKSGIDEIWVTYNDDAGGNWLCHIDFYTNKNKNKTSMKQKIKNWWHNFFKNHIACECPKHLDDLF